MDKRGQIIGGGLKDIYIREKSNEKLELGELLVVDNIISDAEKIEKDFTILQVKDIQYKSQAPQSTHELLAGMELEGYNPDLGFMEPELVNYTVGTAKTLLKVQEEKISKNEKEEIIYKTKSPKRLPDFFNSIRSIKKRDLEFLKPKKLENSLFLGYLRNGSKSMEKMDIRVYIDAIKSLTHHILIPATTGRGKSNLVKVMLWGLLDTKKTGILVLDPHDEYYGRDESLGLSKHPKSKKNLDYYSTDEIIGQNKLKISVKSIKPSHFNGIVYFSSAQKDALDQLYSKHRKDWIEKTMFEKHVPGSGEKTLEVVKRILRTRLKIQIVNDKVKFNSRIFTNEIEGENTVDNIVRALKNGKTVIIDTSKLNDYEELLVGGIVAENLLSENKNLISKDLEKRPAISIVIEEAPRVLGKEAFEGRGSSNIYSTIAREGRKFKIGLIAITQLASLIPKTILANMNTKIILGNEMALERSSVIESASQDLSDDDRIIASLDKGEAIVSSVFTKFAVPIYTPEFNKEFIRKYKENLPKKKTVKGKTNPEG